MQEVLPKGRVQAGEGEEAESIRIDRNKIITKLRNKSERKGQKIITSVVNQNGTSAVDSEDIADGAAEAKGPANYQANGGHSKAVANIPANMSVSHNFGEKRGPDLNFHAWK